MKFISVDVSKSVTQHCQRFRLSDSCRKCRIDVAVQRNTDIKTHDGKREQPKYSYRKGSAPEGRSTPKKFAVRRNSGKSRYDLAESLGDFRYVADCRFLFT